MAAGSRICIIGLGYVGLPLAVGLAAKFRVVGFDVNELRVAELQKGVDRNGEIPPGRLQAAQIEVTGDSRRIADCDVYIITVPTPVDSSNRPDLPSVRAAYRNIGQFPRQGTIVCHESSVYLGVDQDVCGVDLEPT